MNDAAGAPLYEGRRARTSGKQTRACHGHGRGMEPGAWKADPIRLTDDGRASRAAAHDM